MATELEAKLRVPSLDEVRARLAATSAQRIGRVLEINTILDRTPDPLWRRGMALRVRAIEPLDGPTVAPTLTFKGPASAAQFKAREEIEVAVEDAARTIAILGRIGFTPSIVYEKHRESWRLDACHIELDELPTLGTFVEIEATDAKQIERAQRQLGLAAIPHAPESYVAMTARYCAEHQIQPRELRFPPSP